MSYILPRAIIVLIAWGTTCLIVNNFTAIDSLVFYIAGGVWSLVGLMAFSYMHSLHERTEPEPLHTLAPVQTSAE
jgi:hypothetical protein